MKMAHYYSSRGRTRQPKNIVISKHNDGVSGFKADGKVSIVAAANLLAEDLNSPQDGANGYDTQNQDYLHLALSQSTAAARTVDIYAYNRQFGTWGQLKIPINYTGATLDAVYVEAQVISDNSSVKYLVLPIHGIDRVAFVGGTVTGLHLYAAGSTL